VAYLGEGHVGQLPRAALVWGAVNVTGRWKVLFLN